MQSLLERAGFFCVRCGIDAGINVSGIFKNMQGKKNPALGIFGRELAFGLIVAVAVFLAYQPAWNGKLIWDDQQHITKPELRSASGLWHIWTRIGATQQYYPLVHSVFWLEYHVWGESTLGDHLLNILLHSGFCASAGKNS